MFYAYILRSLKDGKTYTGYSGNIKKRLTEHNAGRVVATKNRRPFVFLLIEKCETETDAKHRELYWKSGAGRRRLKDCFKNGFPPIQNL